LTTCQRQRDQLVASGVIANGLSPFEFIANWIIANGSIANEPPAAAGSSATTTVTRNGAIANWPSLNSHGGRHWLWQRAAYSMGELQLEQKKGGCANTRQDSCRFI
jgi:hypothetical protein